MVKNSSTEKKTSPNETVHRKKHFKHIFGGRGRWEIRKKGENFKNNLRLEKKRYDSYKKECNSNVVFLFPAAVLKPPLIGMQLCFELDSFCTQPYNLLIS